MGEIIVLGEKPEVTIREYVHVRYRLRQQGLKQDPYKLSPRRHRLMHMDKLPQFQFELRSGGHSVLGIERITKEEYEERLHALKEKKLAKQQAAATKE